MCGNVEFAYFFIQRMAHGFIFWQQIRPQYLLPIVPHFCRAIWHQVCKLPFVHGLELCEFRLRLFLPENLRREPPKPALPKPFVPEQSYINISLSSQL